MITLLLIGCLKMWYKQGKLPASLNGILHSLSKCRKTKPLLLCLIMNVIVTTAQVQETRSYAVYRNQQLIGKMEAKKITGNEGYTIFLHSINSIKIVTQLKIEVHQKDSFTDEKLSSTLLISKVNGFTNGKKSYSFNHPSQHQFTNASHLPVNGIVFASSSIYFSEPVGVESMYSTNFQQMVPIRKKETGTYDITLPDGKINTYYFKDGICIAATLHSSFSTVHIKLIK